MAGACCLARRQHHVVSLFSLDEAPSKPTFNKRYSSLEGIHYIYSLEFIISIHHYFMPTDRTASSVGLQLKLSQETTTVKLCLRFLRTPTRKIVCSTTTQFQKEFPRIHNVGHSKKPMLNAITAILQVKTNKDHMM